MIEQTARRVDHMAVRVNQAFTIILLAAAFVVDSPALAALTAAAMLVSALFPPLGVFTRVYRHILRPAGIARPEVIPDNPEPHRFAQGVGGTLVALGTVATMAGTSFGWLLVGLVIVLAGLNLFAGWCAGCTMYYWLNRLGVPGFNRSRIGVTR